jgi:hypothetical protein
MAATGMGLSARASVPVIPLDGGLRYLPEATDLGMVLVPVGDEVWERLYLVDTGRAQVLAVLPGNLPAQALGTPGFDLLRESVPGPTLPRRVISTLRDRPGWPVDPGAPLLGPAALASWPTGRILAVTSPAGWVLALTPEGVFPPGWPVEIGIPLSSPPAAGDLDGDGRDEVLVASATGQVFALDAEGRTLPGWPASLPDSMPILAPPEIADIDGDGLPEVLAAGRDGAVAVWSCSGVALPGWPVRVPRARETPRLPWLLSTPLAVQLDGDPELEILQGAGNGWVWAWDTDGQPLPGWPYRVPGGCRAGFSSPVAADLDRDGQEEVFLGTDLGFDGPARLVGLRARGQPLAGWPLPSPQRIHASPALGDLTGDGVPELVLSTVGGEGGLMVLRLPGGEPLPGWPVRVGHVTFNGSPVLADVTGDGQPEVLAAGWDPGITSRVVVVALELSGRPAPGWPTVIEGEEVMGSSPLVADLDEDGTLELVLVTEREGRIHVWELPSSAHPAAVPWPMERGDPARTGRRTTPREAPSRGTRAATVPPGLSTISFELATAAWVTVEIHDLQGRTVRRLLAADLPPGRYELRWDGRDDAGRSLPPGIYVYTLRRGDQAATDQLLLLK